MISPDDDVSAVGIVGGDAVGKRGGVQELFTRNTNDFLPFGLFALKLEPPGTTSPIIHPLRYRGSNRQSNTLLSTGAAPAANSW